MSDRESSPDDLRLADKIVLFCSYGNTYDAIPEKNAENLNDALSSIREMYEAGIPLFTKQTLADVTEQLDTLQSGRRNIVVKGINGKPVDFDIETGRLYSTSGESRKNLERVFTVPHIGYKSYDRMISAEFNTHPSLAYSPLYVCHYIKWRNQITKELLRPSSPVSLQETRDEFVRLQHIWNESAVCQKLKTILPQKLAPRTDTVVAFALGSISHFPARSEACMFQHALLLTLRDLVQTVECYSQDPIYNAVDESVLRESGITVLSNPRAFLKVSDFSIVVSISADVPVREIVADLARPAVIICNRVVGGTHESNLWRTDPVSPRVERMIRDHYEEFPILENTDMDLGTDVTVYVRNKDNDQCQR